MSETIERKPYVADTPFEWRLRGNMLNRIIKKGKTGKTVNALIYENIRYHGAKEELTRLILAKLVECGLLEIVKERKRGYKTVTEKENGNTRYRFTWEF